VNCVIPEDEKAKKQQQRGRLEEEEKVSKSSQNDRKAHSVISQLLISRVKVNADGKKRGKKGKGGGMGGGTGNSTYAMSEGDGGGFNEREAPSMLWQNRESQEGFGLSVRSPKLAQVHFELSE